MVGWFFVGIKSFFMLLDLFCFWVPDSRYRDFRDDNTLYYRPYFFLSVISELFYFLICHPGIVSERSESNGIRDPESDFNSIFCFWVPDSRCRDFRDDKGTFWVSTSTKATHLRQCFGGRSWWVSRFSARDDKG